MRIAVLMSIVSPWARAVATQIANEGVDVHVVDFSSEHEASYLDAKAAHHREAIEKFEKSVTVHRLRPWGGRLRYVAGALSLRQLIRSIEAESTLALYGGGFAAMAHLSGCRPYVVYAVGSDVLLLPRAQRPLARRAYEGAQRVFANGNHLAERLLAVAPKANVTPLIMGVDTDRFVPGQRNEGKTRIMCSRGFLPVYNNEQIVDAIALLDDSLDFKMTFTSSGPLIGQVQERADRVLSSVMRKRVIFRNGVSDDELLRELQSSDIFVSMARSDGTSISLLEALSCGLFPVLSDIPQNREWLVDKNAAFASVDHPEMLASTLRGVMLDAEMRRMARETNRKLAVTKASSKRNLQHLLECMAQISRPRALAVAGA